MNNLEEEIGKKVLEKVINRANHVCAMPNRISLVSVSACDDLALWAIPFTRWGLYTRSGKDEKYFRYCYSDLKGNPLFGEDTFIYATEVHEGYVLIREEKTSPKYLVNLTTLQKTPIDTLDAPSYGEEPWSEVIKVGKAVIASPKKRITLNRLSDCKTIEK